MHRSGVPLIDMCFPVMGEIMMECLPPQGFGRGC